MGTYRVTIERLQDADSAAEATEVAEIAMDATEHAAPQYWVPGSWRVVGATLEPDAPRRATAYEDVGPGDPYAMNW